MPTELQKQYSPLDFFVNTTSASGVPTFNRTPKEALNLAKTNPYYNSDARALGGIHYMSGKVRDLFGPGATKSGNINGSQAFYGYKDPRLLQQDLQAVGLTQEWYDNLPKLGTAERVWTVNLLNAPDDVKARIAAGSSDLGLQALLELLPYAKRRLLDMNMGYNTNTTVINRPEVMSIQELYKRFVPENYAGPVYPSGDPNLQPVEKNLLITSRADGGVMNYLKYISK